MHEHVALGCRSTGSTSGILSKGVSQSETNSHKITTVRRCRTLLTGPSISTMDDQSMH